MGLFDELTDKLSPASAEDFRILLGRSMEDLRIKSGAHDSLWQLGQAAWSIDQQEGTIVFKAPNGIVVTCAVQIVGTYNTADGTWLWGWDHPSVQPPLQVHARLVRAYGEQHGIAPLTTRKLACAENDAWELAALACRLGDAQGAYRAPAGTALVFVTFSDVKINKPGPPPIPSNVPPPIPPSVPPPIPKSSTMSGGAKTSPAGSPEEIVAAFIAAHFAWNQSLNERAKSAPSNDQQAEIEEAGVKEYDALIARFCADTVKAQGISYGDNPMHHPQTESIESSRITGQTALVHTCQVVTDNFKSSYEYHLVEQHGQWRIASLLVVFADGKYECL